MRELRDKSDPTWRAEASKRIADFAFHHPSVAQSRNISIFVGREPEVDTAPLIGMILRSKRFAMIPRVEQGSDRLALHRVTDFPRGFAPGAFGILEPQPEIYPDVVLAPEIDLTFVPGLAFDRAGHRLGYGKGYYDRLLAQSPKCVKIGLGFSFQIVERLPSESHDIRLDGVVTEKEG